jgi:hypothetical protein
MPDQLGTAAWVLGLFLAVILIVFFAWLWSVEKDIRRLQQRLDGFEYTQTERIALPERLRPERRL